MWSGLQTAASAQDRPRRTYPDVKVKLALISAIHDDPWVKTSSLTVSLKAALPISEAISAPISLQAAQIAGRKP